MAISMEKIRQLREKSGAGMADCRRALEESNGDIDQAVTILRKSGIAKAAKRSGRASGEGLIKVAVSADGKEGYILELNSETDFVARNEKFRNLAERILKLIMDKKPQSKEILLGLQLDDITVRDCVDSLSGVIGEKMALKRYDILHSHNTVAAYSHPGGQIGVLVAISKDNARDLAYDMAMQIAAGNPLYIEPKDVPAEMIAKEKEIFTEQLKTQGKPEKILTKIIEGKINKYLEEICLIKQEYIKDDKLKVEDVLKGVKVKKFIRYSL